MLTWRVDWIRTEARQRVESAATTGQGSSGELWGCRVVQAVLLVLSLIETIQRQGARGAEDSLAGKGKAAQMLYAKARLFFEPRDIWVGVYIGKLNKEGMYRDRTIFLIPFPMVGLSVTFVWELCRACGKGWRWTGLHENRGCYPQCG